MASSFPYLVLSFDLDANEDLVRKNVQPCRALADAVLVSAAASKSRAGAIILRQGDEPQIVGCLGEAENEIVALYALHEYRCGLWPKHPVNEHRSLPCAASDIPLDLKCDRPLV